MISKETMTTLNALYAYCRAGMVYICKDRNDYLFQCPLHDKHVIRVYVSNGRGKWRCRGCRRGGDIFDLHAMLTGHECRSQFRLVFKGLEQALKDIGYRDSSPLPAGRRDA